MELAEKALLRVVARLRDGNLVKGYTDALPVSDTEALTRNHSILLPQEIGLRSADSGLPVSLPLESLKALYFVKTFEGRKDYDEVKFFETHPPIEGLWVRLTFYDNETYEGVVRNSLQFLMNDGFFLKPPDPQSNNTVVYVVKASLVDFRVLGVKATY